MTQGPSVRFRECRLGPPSQDASARLQRGLPPPPHLQQHLLQQAFLTPGPASLPGRPAPDSTVGSRALIPVLRAVYSQACIHPEHADPYVQRQGRLGASLTWCLEAPCSKAN